MQLLADAFFFFWRRGGGEEKYVAVSPTLTCRGFEEMRVSSGSSGGMIAVSELKELRLNAWLASVGTKSAV